MKRAVVFMTLILSSCFLWAEAEEGPSRSDSTPGIEVVGEGEARAVADQVVMTFNQESPNKDFAAAKNESGRKTKSLVEALSRLGVSSKNIQTAPIQIFPVYEFQNGKRQFVNYSARQQFIVVLKDVDQYGRALDTVLGAGVTNVNGPEYRTSKKKELEEEAQKIAASEAQEKAETLAKRFGRKVGRAIRIEENEENAWPQPAINQMNAMRSGDAPSDTSGFGEIIVRRSVRVRFELP